MKYASVSIAYNEPRFIKPHLLHLPEWVEDNWVLHSTIPWNGENVDRDDTPRIAKPFASVVSNYWKTEEEQRNTGQDLNQDKDWIIVLDPDEFFDNKNWQILKDFLETTDADAVVIDHQRVFWKDKEVYPCNDYQQLVAVRPHVRFADKRVVNTGYKVAPVELLHFSWARTDEECWNKISHYAHANDFNALQWYTNVWLANKTENLHPVTPETLGGLIEAVLPSEIEKLGLLVNGS